MGDQHGVDHQRMTVVFNLKVTRSTIIKTKIMPWKRNELTHRPIARKNTDPSPKDRTHIPNSLISQRARSHTQRACRLHQQGQNTSRFVAEDLVAVSLRANLSNVDQTHTYRIACAHRFRKEYREKMWLYERRPIREPAYARPSLREGLDTDRDRRIWFNVESGVQIHVTRSLLIARMYSDIDDVNLRTLGSDRHAFHSAKEPILQRSMSSDPCKRYQRLTRAPSATSFDIERMSESVYIPGSAPMVLT